MNRPRAAVAPLLLLTLLVVGCAGLPDVGPQTTADDPQAGLLTLSGGRELYVRPQDLVFTGKASFVWPNGRQFDGAFINGAPDGYGSERLPDGTRYEGHWHRGARHGVGTLELTDGGRYEGDFNHGVREGLGRYQGSSGSYDGHWMADVPDGQGRFDYPDGSRYEGGWDAGQRSGQGAYRKDRSEYQGDWSNDVPHGFGLLDDFTGFKYDGGWTAGERNGYGQTSTRAGLAYEGTWVAGARQGYGLEARPNGARYLGEWRNDSRWGQGFASHPDGGTHEGYWENNTPLGPGTRQTAERVQITGTWNGDFVTSGIVTLPNGQDYAGNLYDRGNKAVNKRFLGWLDKVAQSGEPHAQLLLGDAFQRFESPPPDESIASLWYGRAAATGLAEAQYRLALIFLDTGGRTGRALELLLAAAAQGHAGANVLIGSYYQLGTHVGKNHKRALAYYQVALEGGSVLARNNLAWLLATSARTSLRDGERAVQLAEPMALLYGDWGYVDTLAAAWAESGEYEAAVQAQTRAIRLAQAEGADAATVKDMEQRRALFLDSQPYRE